LDETLCFVNPGSGVMSGTAMDLEIFSKIGLWRSKSVKGKNSQLEIIIIQFLFQFKLIFKENHSQITILFTTSPTTMKNFRIEAL